MAMAVVPRVVVTKVVVAVVRMMVTAARAVMAAVAMARALRAAESRGDTQAVVLREGVVEAVMGEEMEVATAETRARAAQMAEAN